MPGVPSGRACDGCRKQKKKCDEKVPTCSRCTRLGLVCIGSGQRRYKFQEQQTFPANAKKKKNVNSSRIEAVVQTNQKNLVMDIATRIIHSPPSNKITALTSQYVHIIKLSTDLRYNLAWAYGLFMFEIPRRMNTNEALDSAVYALVCSHASFCSRQQPAVEALSSYSHALVILRQCLNEPAKALTSETLCAVMLLLICQSINGTEGQRWSGHCEGAAQILKVRSSMKPQDEFEQQLLLSLRGCLLFEGLFNERINLTSDEWISLVGSELDGKLPEGQLMRYLARMPNIIRRRPLDLGDSEISSLRNWTKPLYQSCKTLLDHLRTNWVACQQHSPQDELSTVTLYAYYQRAYGLGLLIVTVINCVLRTFASASELRELVSDSESLIKETLELAQLANVYRPLGSAYMVISLGTAWLASTNEHDKSFAEILLHDYCCDFPMRAADDFMGELDWMAQKLQSLRVNS